MVVFLMNLGIGDSVTEWILLNHLGTGDSAKERILSSVFTVIPIVVV